MTCRPSLQECSAPWSVRSVPLCTAIACFPEPVVFFPQCAGVARSPAAWKVLSTMLTLTWPCLQRSQSHSPSRPVLLVGTACAHEVLREELGVEPGEPEAVAEAHLVLAVLVQPNL